VEARKLTVEIEVSEEKMIHRETSLQWFLSCLAALFEKSAVKGIGSITGQIDRLFGKEREA
jgi:hypothetical protein